MNLIMQFVSLCKGALKEFKFGRWLFGVIAVISVIGLAKATKYSYQVFAFGAIGVFLCGGLLAIAGAAFEQRRRREKPPGFTLAFIWLCLALFAIWSLLFTSCVFFSFPKSPEEIFKVDRTNDWFPKVDAASVRQPKLLSVPGGKLLLGTSYEEATNNYQLCLQRFPKPQDCVLEYFTDECPPLEVYVDEFWIDDIEVTQYAYMEAVRAGVCEPPRLKPVVLGANTPIVGVRWVD